MIKCSVVEKCPKKNLKADFSLKWRLPQCVFGLAGHGPMCTVCRTWDVTYVANKLRLTSTPHLFCSSSLFHYVFFKRAHYTESSIFWPKCYCCYLRYAAVVRMERCVKRKHHGAFGSMHCLFLTLQSSTLFTYIQPWLHSVSFNALVTITMTTALKAPQKSYVLPDLPVSTDSASFWIRAVDKTSSQKNHFKNPHVAS